MPGSGTTMTNAGLIELYIRAKDGNRPHLMPAAFAPDAALTMVVNTGSISFPPKTEGLEAITDVLVRRFCQAYENVYTFCLCEPPAGTEAKFSCAWLVGMSEKEGGKARAGCGRYDWSFRAGGADRLVERLTITIDVMLALPQAFQLPVLEWVKRLPYPWCPAGIATQAMPRAPELEVVAGALRR